MNLTVKVTGLEKIIDNFNKLKKVISSNELKEYIAKKAINEINIIAEERLSESDNYIKNNKYELKDNNIIIFNDVKEPNGKYYSLIIEYGSGTYAEGEPFHYTETYNNTNGLYWLVPVEDGSSLFNTGFDIITLESGDYFKVYGQEPKHIYTDAAKIIQKNISYWIKEYIQKEMK